MDILRSPRLSATAAAGAASLALLTAGCSSSPPPQPVRCPASATTESSNSLSILVGLAEYLGAEGEKQQDLVWNNRAKEFTTNVVDTFAQGTSFIVRSTVYYADQADQGAVKGDADHLTRLASKFLRITPDFAGDSTVLNPEIGVPETATLFFTACVPKKTDTAAAH